MPPLLLFAACAVLFHFANAAMLPLVGQKLALQDRNAGTSFMSACIVAAQIIMVPMALLVGRRANCWGRKPLFLAASSFCRSAARLHLLRRSLLACRRAITRWRRRRALWSIISADRRRSHGRHGTLQCRPRRCDDRARDRGIAVNDARRFDRGRGRLQRRLSHTGPVAAVGALVFFFGMPETYPQRPGKIDKRHQSEGRGIERLRTRDEPDRYSVAVKAHAIAHNSRDLYHRRALNSRCHSAPLQSAEAIWAMAGAVLLVALGLMSIPDALTGVAKGTDVYLFLFGMMLLAEIAREEGLFDWLAAVATSHAKGSPRRLFLVDLRRRHGRDHLPVERRDRGRADAGGRGGGEGGQGQAAPALSAHLRLHRQRGVVRAADLEPGQSRDLRQPHAAAAAMAAGLSAAVAACRSSRPICCCAGPSAARSSSASPRTCRVPTLSAAGKMAAVGIAATAVVLLAASALDIQLGLPTAIAGALTAMRSC